MKSKAAVAKALNDAGIPLPKEDSYDSMMHRLNTWQAGHGYLFRRMKSRFYAQQKLPAEIPLGTVIWVPNSNKPKPKAKPKKTSKPKSNSKVKADGGNNNSDS